MSYNLKKTVQDSSNYYILFIPDKWKNVASWKQKQYSSTLNKRNNFNSFMIPTQISDL